MLLDAWTFIPFMMIMILAGLQAIPKELKEAARVDGASPWKSFWEVTFPLMLPVSVTAILIRIIFKLKLADIVITVTAGGPGGATDTVTSLHLPRVPRPVERRLRHAACDGLSRHHHHRDDDPDETRRTLREAADMSDADLPRQRERSVVPGEAVRRQDR